MLFLAVKVRYNIKALLKNLKYPKTLTADWVKRSDENRPIVPAFFFRSFFPPLSSGSPCWLLA
jgi:hypothetical protein